MEAWRKVWREGVAPLLSDTHLEALEKALVSDDPRLLQGATTTPPPLMCVQDWPVEAACALGYCGWRDIETKINGEQESVKPSDAIEIKLTQGKVTWVSPSDYPHLSKLSWWTLEHHGRWYACRTEYLGGGRANEQKRNIKMHQEIMVPPKGMVVDHIDRNGLNNTRDNLRLVTEADNKRNCRRFGKSIFRGVYPSPTKGRWCAKLSDGGKSVYLGTFTTEHEAAAAFNKAASERFGDKSVLNRFATVREVEEFFARMCYEIDLRVGEPAGCRWFLNWFDDTPRDEMRSELLTEVRLVTKTRDKLELNCDATIQ